MICAKSIFLIPLAWWVLKPPDVYRLARIMSELHRISGRGIKRSIEKARPGAVLQGVSTHKDSPISSGDNGWLTAKLPQHDSWQRKTAAVGCKFSPLHWIPPLAEQSPFRAKSFSKMTAVTISVSIRKPFFLLDFSEFFIARVVLEGKGYKPTLLAHSPLKTFKIQQLHRIEKMTGGEIVQLFISSTT